MFESFQIWVNGDLLSRLPPIQCVLEAISDDAHNFVYPQVTLATARSGWILFTSQGVSSPTLVLN